LILHIALSPTSFQVIANGQQLMVRCPPGIRPGYQTRLPFDALKVGGK